MIPAEQPRLGFLFNLNSNFQLIMFIIASAVQLY